MQGSTKVEVPRGYEKRCPTCHAVAAIDQSQCLGCGRQFRTQFVSADPPKPAAAEKTMAVPQGWVPPPDTMTAPYHRRDVVNDSSFVMDECRRQYKLANLFIVIGCWLSPTLALILLAVYGVTQKGVIRRRIAETGTDAAAWAAPLDRWLLLAVFAPVIALIASFAMVALFGTAMIGCRGNTSAVSSARSAPEYTAVQQQQAAVQARYRADMDRQLEIIRNAPTPPPPLPYR